MKERRMQAADKKMHKRIEYVNCYSKGSKTLTRKLKDVNDLHNIKCYFRWKILTEKCQGCLTFENFIRSNYLLTVNTARFVPSEWMLFGNFTSYHLIIPCINCANCVK